MLLANKLSKVDQSESPRKIPSEWQYWLFSNNDSARNRRQVKGVISAATRDSLDAELEQVRSLRKELANAHFEPAGKDSLFYDAPLGPIAVYDERNSYGGLINQGIRALRKFIVQRSAIMDSLRIRPQDSTAQHMLTEHTQSLIHSYDEHYKAQERIDGGEIIRDMSVVRRLDTTLNVLGNQQNKLRERISRMRPTGRIP